MEGFVKSRWAELGEVRVHLMGKGLFVFQLESEDAKQGALERGPWSFSRRPLILRSWTVGMALEKPDVDNLPIWVQYPHLPIDLWTTEVLSQISSQMGKPLFADWNTSEQRRLGYTRVCVEVKVDSTLFEEIPVKYANRYVHYQKVHYEWVPSKCSKCKVFGHTDQSCKAVQVFVPRKDTGKAVVIEEGVATSSGSLQFGAIDRTTFLPTPVGSVCTKPREARPDTPAGRGVLEVPVLQLSPIGEDDGGEGIAQASGSKVLEANILQKVSSVIAQLAAESAEQQGGGSVGKNKKKGKGNGQAVVPPPKPA
ncbi:hypothetical protein LIER_42947 [Lithospermum erythrorhizon]|uniref:DUF4283 domain-containing protein n=1 Tax=Lithospermum erythrorhizon TaxID=34254 RepID=A0AAV3PBC6_LITER